MPPSPSGERHRDQALRLLFDNAREYAIFLLDPDAQITHWNEGAERVLGWTEAEVVGRSGEIVFTPEQRAEGVPEAEIRTALREGRAEDTRWHVRRDGSRFWANGMMIALRDEAGALRGLAKVLRDETERKRAEDALGALRRSLEDQVAERTGQVRRLAAQLAEAEAEGLRHAAAVLHDDVQQRLYGLHLGVGDLLRALEEQGQRALAERARRVRRWSAEALDLTRLLAADLTPTVATDGTLADALGALREQADALFGFRLAVEGAEDAPALPSATVALVARALREAVFNAVKHADTDGATVRLHRTAADTLTVVVEDGGSGFDVGTPSGGLGLSRMQARMALAGGEARVESVPGDGTRVVLSVPLADPPGGGAAGADISAPA